MVLFTGTDIARRLLILGVVAVAIVPKQHIDPNYPWWHIGGNLSKPFKKVLIFLVALNFLRVIASTEGAIIHSSLFADTLGVVENVGMSFLCYLTPYILQKWMSNRINIGGRPGSGLMAPLCATLVLCSAGTLLGRNVHPNLLALKRIGNAVSTPPVLWTLRLFNSISTRGGHHEGRGTVISQTLMVLEKWYMLIELCDAAGNALRSDSRNPEDYGQWDHLCAAFREVSFMAKWIRICGHSIFINLLDELYLVSPAAAAATGEEGAGDNDGNSSDKEMEALVVRSKV